MKFFASILSVIFLCGCTGIHKEGVSRFDDYDAVKVDQMVGNNVSGTVFQKTILCLNGRRETRRVTTVTNQTIVNLTNQTVTPVTNLTITLATNLLVTASTNLNTLPPPPPIAAAKPEEAATTPPADPAAPAAPAVVDPAAPAKETNTVVVITNLAPSITTNHTVSLAANLSSTAAPNQNAANRQYIRTLSHQVTTTSNNIAVTWATNEVITAETNQVVFHVTNTSLSAVTNVVVVKTNLQVHDYYLFTELTPPPDFTLAAGESLALLVDGTRYAFAATNSQAAFVARKGFTPTFYKVPGEVLVAIANAKDVRVRLRGANTTIEREMSGSSISNFKDFLLNHFTAGSEKPAPAPAKPKPSPGRAGVGPAGSLSASVRH